MHSARFVDGLDSAQWTEHHRVGALCGVIQTFHSSHQRVQGGTRRCVERSCAFLVFGGPRLQHFLHEGISIEWSKIDTSGKNVALGRVLVLFFVV